MGWDKTSALDHNTGKKVDNKNNKNLKRKEARGGDKEPAGRTLESETVRGGGLSKPNFWKNVKNLINVL